MDAHAVLGPYCMKRRHSGACERVQVGDDVLCVGAMETGSLRAGEVFCIEIDVHECTENPLWVPPEVVPTDIASSADTRVAGNASSPDTRVAPRCIRVWASYILPCVLGLVYFCAGLVGIALARGFRFDGDSTSFVELYWLYITPFELMLLPTLFIVGITTYVQSKNENEKALKKVMVAFATITASAILAAAVLGPMPPATTVITVGSGNVRGSCKLFTPGYPLSESHERYSRVHEFCPGIANSTYFHALMPGMEETGADIEMVMERGAALHSFRMSSTSDRLLNAFFKVSMQLSCALLFPKCRQHDCQRAEPCTLFDDDWYTNDLTDRDRSQIVDDFPSTIESIEGFVLLSADEQMKQQLHLLVQAYKQHLPLIRKTMHHPPNASSCRDPVGPVGVGKCHRQAQNENQERRITIPNAVFEQWKHFRAAIVLGPILLSWGLYCSLLWRKVLVVQASTRASLKVKWKLHALRCFCFVVIFGLGTALIYGGSLSSVGDSRSNNAISGVYLVCALVVFYGFGFFLHKSNTERAVHVRQGTESDGTERRGIVGQCLGHPLVQFLGVCNNPTRPEYLYRIVFMECIEVFIQVGAMLGHQHINGDIVLISLLLVMINAVLMAGCLQCVRNSPRRSQALLAMEICFDIFFAIYGILRLNSNATLQLLGHLALIKPVLSLSVDLYDLFILLRVSRYTVVPTQSVNIGRLLVVRKRHVRVNSCNTAKKLLGLWFIPGLLVILSAVTTSRFISIERTCVEEIGQMALCASERFYFNVPWGILGDLACSFEDVQTLSCSGGNVRFVPPNIAGLMPRLIHVNLSHNPFLVSIPATLGNIPSVSVLDVSYTRLKTLPPQVVNLSRLRVLRVRDTPTSVSLNWSNQGLTDVPWSSAFYTAFAPTLERFDLSRNHLRGALFSQACWFHNLRYLNISFNAINTLGDGLGGGCDVLTQLPRLTDLDISNNDLTTLSLVGNAVDPVVYKQMHISALGNPLYVIGIIRWTDATLLSSRLHQVSFPFRDYFVQLDKCTFKGTDLLPWPKALQMNTKIVLLYTGSHITGTLDVFSPFKSIVRLDVVRGGNFSGGLLPLANLTSLEDLMLLDIGISGDLEPLRRLERLRILDLDFNKITGTVEPLRQLMRLEYLDLQYNAISGTVLPICHMNRSNSSIISLGHNQMSGSLDCLNNLPSDHLMVEGNKFS